MESDATLTCPMCGTTGEQVFMVADVWHCDECQASGEIAVDDGVGELVPTDAENSSRTRVVVHIARMVSHAQDLPREQSETIVRYVLDYIKWGLPRGS